MANIKDVILVKYSDTLKRDFEHYNKYIFKYKIGPEDLNQEAQLSANEINWHEWRLMQFWMSSYK